MTVAVLYKWTCNPQDASVSSDGVVNWSGAKPAVSEYDTVAIEVGRQVADAASSEYVGVCLGNASVVSSVARKSVMSRGLDWAIMVADDVTSTWNAVDVGRALATMIQRIGDVDLVVAGDMSLDEAAGIVPGVTAGYLGWSCLLNAAKVERSADGWIVEQVVSGGTRTIQVNGPLVVSVTTDAAKPRVPGIKDVLAADKKRVDSVPVEELPKPESVLTATGQSLPPKANRLNKIFALHQIGDLVDALRSDGVL